MFKQKNLEYQKNYEITNKYHNHVSDHRKGSVCIRMRKLSFSFYMNLHLSLLESLENIVIVTSLMMIIQGSPEAAVTG